MKKPTWIVVVLVITGVALWWLTRPTEETSVLRKIVAIAIVPKPTIQMPIFPPSPNQSIVSPTSVSTMIESQPNVGDQHAADLVELKANILDMISLLEANDFADFNARYASSDLQKIKDQVHARFNARTLPPSTLPTDAERKEASQNNPQLPLAKLPPAANQAMQGMLSELKAIQDFTPTFNKAGNQVDYPITPEVAATIFGQPQHMYFQKINGQWYIGN